MKSMEEIISNVVWTTGVMPEVHRKIQELAATEPRWDAASERTLWVKWGRTKLPQRLLNAACLVITRATYGEKTKMHDIATMLIGGSHNTMFHLLDHFSQLCVDEKWPFYPSCITDKDGNIPSGCQAWLIRHGHMPVGVVPEDHLKALQDECLTSIMTPNGHEVALAVADYIYKHKL